MTKPNQAPTPVPLGLRPSFGFGDRLGLATPGHVEAMRRAGQGIAPIYPQQSIREMTRTSRSPETVMADAVNAAVAAGWTDDFGADADHLKTPADVDRTSAVGFCFFTIDPSDAVDAKADNYPADVLKGRYTEVRDEIDWFDKYNGKNVKLATGTLVVLNDEAVMRAAVKYGRALNRGIELADYIRIVNERAGRDYEIELSVDETDQPTTLAEHYIIADQCLGRGMKLVSLAPRFVGTLEKGVDYIGNVREFEKSLRDHQAIAELLGPYKLSLHSGSDKLSIYPSLARATGGRFHVKTAGTSYLEALRVVARHDPKMFRTLCEFSRGRYDVDKATYHVHATLEMVPAPADVSDDHKLEQLYLECWEDVPDGAGFTAPGRQILHCTFGSALTDSKLGGAVRDCLKAHPGTYLEILAVHFEKHLRALQVGMLKLPADTYRPFGKTGLKVPPIVFGCSALGNLYRVIPNVAKLEIVSEWLEHVAPPVFIDTAGKYGAGLAMEVLGQALAKFEIPPGDVLISSKLGWKRASLTASEPTFEPGVWKNIEHDAVQRISYDGILDCWEESCRLLGEAYKPRLVSVHDPDEYLAAAATPDERRRRFDDIVGAYRALTGLREQGQVIGVGVGAKDWLVVQEIFDAVPLDWVMLANCLTVLRHPPELLAFIARLFEQDVAIINSAVFHSGFLVGGKYFDYRIVKLENDADRPLFAWRKSFVALCEAHGISPMHACVQFGLSVPGMVAVALNTSHADRIRENVSAVATPVPPQFWASLKEEGLVAKDYPYVG